MDLKRGSKLSAEGSMSSMTDLVFLLLIFFVILSTFAKDPGIEVETPSSSTATPHKTESVEIAIKPTNGITRVYVNTREFTYIDRSTNTIDKEALAGVVAGYFKEGENKVVELKADRAVQYDMPAQVIDMVKQNQWKIVLTYQAN